MKDRNVRRLSQFHRVLYRLTGGRIGNRLVDNDMLLLSTTGEITGCQHTVPLLYLLESGSYVVVASFGGRDHHPQWYHNLAANPAAEVQVNSRRIPVQSRTTTAGERAKLWPRVVAAYEQYEVYQSRTDREIPLVILTPV